MVVTEPQPDGMHSYYVIVFVKSGRQCRWKNFGLIERSELSEVVRKKSYLPEGEIEADIRYSDYQMFGTIPFPMKIVINRPIENYSLEMNIQKTGIEQDQSTGDVHIGTARRSRRRGSEDRQGHQTQ